VRVRHNDLDRLPVVMPLTAAACCTSNIASFYARLDYAHEKWTEILNDDENILVCKLEKGDMVAVSNQRALHGRCSFELATDDTEDGRNVIGCYVGQDDLSSRFKCRK
jgi:hypothetical protein